MEIHIFENIIKEIRFMRMKYTLDILYIYIAYLTIINCMRNDENISNENFSKYL